MSEGVGIEPGSIPKFEEVMVSVGQGRSGREVPSKELDPGKTEVRGRAGGGLSSVQILDSAVGRTGFVELALTLWKEVPEEIVEKVPEEIM